MSSVAITTNPRSASLRMRSDLVVSPQWFSRKRYWAVKDPASLKYFHLRDEEFALLQMLDGQTSEQELRRRFEQQFSPRKLSRQRLQAFLARLHRDGLVIAESAGQGEQLLERSHQLRRRRRFAALASVLAIRFRGFDPERLLNWLYPRVRWVFSPWALGVAGLLAIAAIALVLVQSELLLSRLPDFQVFFSTSGVLWILASLAVVKVLHEFGHALACKHFGGECHEMGLMLLVFTPCLYVNVSDAWMLPGKWQRIAISAAGMIVEIVLASIATFLWWFSTPGLLNTLALNTMFVCSVSTLLLNGNPLLRYDGYYILSDLIETPNLGQRSQWLLLQWLARVCLGVELEDDQAVPESRQPLLIAYAIASFVYRILVIGVILWFLTTVLRPYGLVVLAQLIGVLVIGGMVSMPLMKAVQYVRNPLPKQPVHRGRLALTLAVALLLFSAAWFVPVPTRVSAPVVIEPEGAQRLYVSVPGTLDWALEAGSHVTAGDQVARLENLSVELEIARLQGERNQQELRLANLRSRRGQDAEAASQIPAAQAALADIDERLAQRLRDGQRLKLVSTAEGTVLPPPTVTHTLAAGQLGAWQGTPLEARNLGSFLETGTLVCQIGDPQRVEAVLIIDQSQIDQIAVGQTVRILLEQLPGEVIEGTISEIAAIDLKVTPRELTAEDLAARTDESGVARPIDTLYQARVTLDSNRHPLLIGARGRAKVLVAAQPLGRQLARYLRSTFHFSL